jgi:hypothetical protein
MKFSPCGKYLAVATKENPIVDIYSTVDYKNISTLTGSSGYVIQFDWSLDSNTIVVNTTEAELLYFNVKDGSQVLRTSKFKNEEWASWNQIYGWPVQGIWKENESVTTCDRSKKEINDAKLLVAGNDKGAVRLYK